MKIVSSLDSTYLFSRRLRSLELELLTIKELNIFRTYPEGRGVTESESTQRNCYLLTVRDVSPPLEPSLGSSRESLAAMEATSWAEQGDSPSAPASRRLTHSSRVFINWNVIPPGKSFRVSAVGD